MNLFQSAKVSTIERTCTSFRISSRNSYTSRISTHPSPQLSASPRISTHPSPQPSVSRFSTSPSPQPSITTFTTKTQFKESNKGTNKYMYIDFLNVYNFDFNHFIGLFKKLLPA